MTSRLVGWLFRRFVAPRIIGYVWEPRGSTYRMKPEHVEVVFRGYR